MNQLSLGNVEIEIFTSVTVGYGEGDDFKEFEKVIFMYGSDVVEAHLPKGTTIKKGKTMDFILIVRAGKKGLKFSLKDTKKA